jgi:GAF domain-containing protein
MYGTNQDITERKQAQETIAKRAVELATVAEITTRVSTIQNPDEMLQTAVDLTRQTFSLYHVHIYLLNESGDTLVISKGAGEIGRMMVAEGQKIGLDAEKSLTARAARTRQGVIVNDVRQDPYFLAHPLLSETRSEMAVPMIAGDRLLGVIDVQDTQINRFTPEDVNIMTTLAAQIAVSLQNARSFARAQRQAEREALINAISERIQATNSVENALQVAVREIGRALGAQHTAIRLGLERKTDGEEDAKS